MKKRVGSSSARWGWMRRMVLRRFDGVAYLDRIRVVQTPWFGIYLHRFDAPDPGNDLHDHPWPFVTTVLCGGYTEVRADVRTVGVERIEHVPRFRPKRMRLTEAHTIAAIDRPGTRSLVLVGRRSRSWGFYVDGRFVDHHVYDFNRRDMVLQEDR